MMGKSSRYVHCLRTPCRGNDMSSGSGATSSSSAAAAAEAAAACPSAAAAAACPSAAPPPFEIRTSSCNGVGGGVRGVVRYMTKDGPSCSKFVDTSGPSNWVLKRLSRAALKARLKRVLLCSNCKHHLLIADHVMSHDSCQSAQFEKPLVLTTFEHDGHNLGASKGSPSPKKAANPRNSNINNLGEYLGIRGIHRCGDSFFRVEQSLVIP